MAQPWHVGPAPVTSGECLQAALTKWLKQVRTGLVISGYSNKKQCNAIDVRSILKMSDLIILMLEAQPKARFLPTQLRRILTYIKRDSPGVCVNPTDLSDCMWGKIVTSEISTLFHHWRKLTNNFDEHAKDLTMHEATKLRNMIARAPAENALASPPKKRKLARQTSACSAGSAVSVDYAIVPNILSRFLVWKKEKKRVQKRRKKRRENRRKKRKGAEEEDMAEDV